VDIPDICKSWREKIESGDNPTQRILGNLRRDNCIESKISDEFFQSLADKGNPCSPEDAKNTAIDVIRADPDKFVCQGGEIPSDSFNTLFRLEDVTKLGKHLPDEHLRKFGIRDRKSLNSKDLPDDELSDIVHMYKGTLDLGNRLDIVWVADNEKTEQIGLKDLVVRLGLDNLKTEKRCLKIVYVRGKLEKSLHLPRSFDGIDNGQFEVVEDCKADAGMTLPLNLPPEQGLSEAVHRGCKVEPEILKVEPIE
jgi:hypothetical protein